MRLACSAPTRVDLAGGTIDLWPLYLFHPGAQTINAALSLRAHCQIAPRADGRVVIVSEDTRERIEAAGPGDLDVDRLPLIARLVRYFGARGVEVTTRSESPVGAGLGGSSAMCVAATSALAAWTEAALAGEALLTLAMNIETQVLGVPAGVQDYRPAYYGGVLAIELGLTGTPTTPLRVDPDELARRLVVAYTGASRNSGVNNWDVYRWRIERRAPVIAAFDGIRDATTAMRAAFERTDWPGVAAALSADWQARRHLSAAVTTPLIDQLLEGARAAGARAGKVCGAGGGGCLVCVVDPDAKAAVSDALAAGGATVLPITIERQGVRIERL